MTEKLQIVTLCTGNVARSVMLDFMLTTLAGRDGLDWHVRSAGTFVAEGAAMSARTREALVGIAELGDHRYGAHRSHQLRSDDVEWADVILAVEADHVRFVRRHFAAGAVKTVQLVPFVVGAGVDQSWADHLASAAALEPQSRLDVVDPAGGDQATYHACARQLWSLARAFAALPDLLE